MTAPVNVPPIGLGTWPLVGDDATRAVLSGIEVGYRHIDTAAIYGNEDAVGRAVQKSGVSREDLFVTSKLRGSDHISGDIRGAVERSLAQMGLDYLDMYLIHWPLPRFDRYVAAFAGLLECRDAGLIRYTGVSNFLGTHVRRVTTECGEAPAVNQIQMDPSLVRIPLREVNDELGILTSSWSPLGRGNVIGDPAVTEIATARGCAPAQLVLAWHLANDVVPVARSADRVRQAQNFGALDVELDAEEIARLSALDRGESAARDVEREEHF
jgi:2,5-diketo-D-gluconate reductase A